jgi:hypothetical protein
VSLSLLTVVVDFIKARWWYCTGRDGKMTWMDGVQLVRGLRIWPSIIIYSSIFLHNSRNSAFVSAKPLELTVCVELFGGCDILHAHYLYSLLDGYGIVDICTFIHGVT